MLVGSEKLGWQSGCGHEEVAQRDRSLCWLRWWFHQATHITKLHESCICTHTSTCKTDVIWMSSMGCTKVNFLALRWCYRSERCHHWEKTGEGWLEHLCPCLLQLPMNLQVFQNKKVKEIQSCALSCSHCRRDVGEIQFPQCSPAFDIGTRFYCGPSNRFSSFSAFVAINFSLPVYIAFFC